MKYRHNRLERGPLYRSRNGMICGVCKGLAEHFGIPVTGLRIIMVLILIFSGIWPFVLVYFVAALVMKPEPVVPLSNRAEEEFYNSYMSSRSMALYRLKESFENLDRRLQRMESVVTDKDYEWENRVRR